MKTISLFFRLTLVCLLFGLSVPLLGQTDSTFTVYLPKVGFPPDDEGQGWSRPRVWGQYNNSATDDSITVPNGRPIYALLVSGYSKNDEFNEIYYYKFARHLQTLGAYVHFAWWNNLLAPYMERPLHFDQSYPGNSANDLTDFITADSAASKALPGEDYQFVSDAFEFLKAILQHNPNAMIIVVGHSLGGGAVIHLADRVGKEDSLRIDILAPIDPVGNRNYAFAPPSQLGESYYNFTRWRVTRSRFLGFRKLIGQWPDCMPAGNWLKDYNDAKYASDPTCIPSAPHVHSAPNELTLGSNIVNLFHAWQNEWNYPFDYSDNYTFSHNRPPDGSTWQSSIPMGSSGPDPGGWPGGIVNQERLCCPEGDGQHWDTDGHGEIVGYRGPIGWAALGTMFRTSPSCGNNCLNLVWPNRYKENGNWVDPFSNLRRSLLVELENLPSGMLWGHRPYNPALCKVSPFLINLLDRILIQVWFFQQSGTSNDIRAVHFTDSTTGWVSIDNGNVRHTTNGGETWTQQITGTSNQLWDVFFTDQNNGWVVGDNGTIFNTTNGGTNWTQQPSGTSTVQFRGISFINHITGWVVGSNGAIRHTTNSGTTWVSQSSGTSNSLYSVHFTDENNGWIAVSSGNVRHTTDGGATWAQQVTGNSSPLRSIFFTDVNTGWAAGENGTIIHTTDGGNTWTNQPSGTSHDIYSIYFSDPNNGWVAIVQSGNVRHTSDGGLTWIQQPNGNTNRLDDVFFTDANKGWAVGVNGTILHTTGGSSTPPQPPTLSSPPNGSIVSINPLISWASSSTALWYTVQVSVSPNFLTYVVNQSNITDNYFLLSGLTNNTTYYWRVSMTDSIRTSGWSDTWSFIADESVSVPQEPEIPQDFCLDQSYPNPFNPTTTIVYDLPENNFVSIKVYDVVGNKVAIIVNEEQTAGSYEVNFNASNLSSGIYFYTMQAGNFMETKKMVLMK